MPSVCVVRALAAKYPMVSLRWKAAVTTIRLTRVIETALSVLAMSGRTPTCKHPFHNQAKKVVRHTVGGELVLSQNVVALRMVMGN